MPRVAHLWGGASLPSILDELYTSYKRKTQKVVDWIVQEAGLSLPGSQCNCGLITVAELKSAALQIKDRGNSAPEHLFFDLTDAISQRREVTHHYKSWCPNPKAHASHDHFTRQLQEILWIFFPTPPAIARNCRQKKVTKPCSTATLTAAVSTMSIQQPSSSRTDYEAAGVELPTKPLLHHNQQDVYPRSDDPVPEQTLPSDDMDEQPSSTTISDDNLTLDWAVARWSIEVDDLLEELMKYWDEAARGQTPLVLATLLAVVSMHVIDDSRYSSVKLFSLETYLQETGDLAESLCLKMREASASTTSIPPPFINVHNLMPVFYGINAVIGDADTRKPFWNPSLSTDSKPQKPEDVEFFPEVNLDNDLDITSLPAYHMIAGLRLALLEDELDDEFEAIRGVGPGYYINSSLASGFMKNICKAQSCQLDNKSRLASGLNIQMRLYQAWLRPSDGKPQKINCRVKLLRFLKESTEALENVLDHPIMRHCCECIDMAAKEFGPYLAYLKALSASKRFDLYHQAPTTVGVQIMAISARNNIWASFLCNNQGVVGAVLHLYNALEHKGHLTKIPLFENLCNILRDIVFFGSRNASNCSSVYRLFMGAKLMKSKSPKGKNKARKAKKRGLEFPEDVPSTLEKGRWSLKNFTAAHTFAEKGADMLFWAHIQEIFLKHSGKVVPQKRYMVPQAYNRMLKADSAKAGMAEGLYTLKLAEEILRPEFCGEFPAALVNWFRVCHTCFDIVTAVNKRLLEVAELLQPAINHDISFGPQHGFTLFVDQYLLSIQEINRAGPWRTGMENLAVTAVVEGIQSVEIAWDQDKHLFKNM